MLGTFLLGDVVFRFAENKAAFQLHPAFQAPIDIPHVPNVSCLRSIAHLY